MTALLACASFKPQVGWLKMFCKICGLRKECHDEAVEWAKKNPHHEDVC